ncbi:transcriptional regulator, TetR family domain protein [Burkholderia pseudomallei MSHR5613]|nr:transcriptional regulator, TetR family domain protein [Burkholderia pseudomallei MSHR5492]KGS39236.1 transcriptional regulator, TetR family domain protein [Burkholderia pseudomallei MSHR5613]
MELNGRDSGWAQLRDIRPNVPQHSQYPNSVPSAAHAAAVRIDTNRHESAPGRHRPARIANRPPRSTYRKRRAEACKRHPFDNGHADHRRRPIE